MKPLWRGNLAFSLVTIPIQLYTAVKTHSLGFNLLHNKCHNPIVYERWCKHCNKQVSWDEIVKGLKLPDGTYFIITHEKLRALKPEKTDELTIKEFIHKDQLDLLYTNDHFYAVPGVKGQRTYMLFAHALQKTETIAIGTFVMREKEHLCAIIPYQSILLITTLHYAYEIQPVPAQLKPALITAKSSKEELSLAQELISKNLSPKFNLAKYKDTFAQKLLAAIKAQKKHPRVKVAERVKKQAVGVEKGGSLVEALKKSLKTKGPSRRPR